MLALGTTPVSAEVKLAPVFGDHMVLQRGVEVPVWGQAAPGETVEVAFQKQRHSATAGRDGSWMVRLSALSGTAEGADLSVKGTNTLVLKDVVVGEVWMCAGQSNMRMTVGESEGWAGEQKAAQQPQIRLLAKPGGEWRQASPETAGDFSAVAYYFARELQPSIDVPVGLITAAVGGTAGVEWTPKDALQSDPELWSYYHDHAMAEYKRLLAEYEAAKTTAPAGKPPRPPKKRDPGSWYAQLVQPFTPFPVRGVLWYQGESDAPNPELYAKLFATLISSWRQAWQNENLPFLFVQLPNFDDQGQPGERWARVRESQVRALSLPGTGMIVTIDIGGSLHPGKKREVGRRLALLAREKVYGHDVQGSSPLFREAIVEGSTIRVRFQKGSGPLVWKSFPPQSLKIAGADGKFLSGVGVFEGGDLIVSNPKIPSPVAVRYACSNTPQAALFGGNDLPAAPFRSDSWSLDASPGTP